MIGRKNRFHGRGSLQRHYQRSKSVRAGTMALRFLLNERRAQYRLAVVVSRKVSKSAVVRNRIRRRIYENVRILSSNFSGAYDLAIIVYDEKTAQLPAPELTAEIQKLFHKAFATQSQIGPKHAIVKSKENA